LTVMQSPPRKPSSPAGPPGSPTSIDRKASGRARDLLRQHYGLRGLAIPAPSGKPNDPLDIDSPAFEAQGYYDQLIATSSLPALLKRENALFTEIRQLDGERQSLVYNHHHELIAASDTIRAMKARAEDLDSDLEKLKAAFSEISRIGANLSVEQSTNSEGRKRSDM